MKQTINNSNSLVMSYLNLRKVIGILGVSLPFILLLGALIIFKTGIIEASISDYYYTGMGDIFVGTLFVMGAFLLSYKGYEKKDDLAGDLACFFAIGIALFPTTPFLDPTTIERIVGVVHLVFASSFFLTLAYFSLFLFTKTNPKKPPTDRKLRRNQIYRICGYTILIAIALVVFVEVVLPSNLEQIISAYKPIFWLESIIIVAFGISWLTKGEAILSDHT